MTRLSSQQYRRAILATDLAWDPDHIPDKLVLYDEEGNVIDLLDVQGPMGPPGPAGGADSVALTAQPVLDVGLPNQIRAGRALVNADFTDMGLNVPHGLWNLSDLNDASGNGRSFTNKGGVPFAVGINGLANTAVRLVGNTGQALYIPDTGAADSFRIRTGSFGCWFRSGKPSLQQALISKWSAASGNFSWHLSIGSTNNVVTQVSTTGANVVGGFGKTNVCDDRWHHAVATYDGTMLCLYVDGLLENTDLVTGYIFPGNGPMNIGALYADAATVGVTHHYGRVDEAFVTSDVLSEDQVRNLYCAKIPHTLGATPRRASVGIRRLRRSSALVAGDFGTLPLRIYNFAGGSLADEGSQNVLLVNNGGAVPIASAGGIPNEAMHFGAAQSLSSGDAGMPTGLATRSYGCWLKTGAWNVVQMVFAWGLDGATRTGIYLSAGPICSITGGSPLGGPQGGDGQWHHVVAVEDNAAADGLKRKLYVDGRLANTSTSLPATALGGANHFRIGADVDGTIPFTGQIDGVFVSGAALTTDDVYKMYAKGVRGLTPSPKNTGDHVEAWNATHVLATFDSLASNAQVDLGVAL